MRKKETNAPEEDGKWSSLLTLSTIGFSRVFGLRVGSSLSHARKTLWYPGNLRSGSIFVSLWKLHSGKCMRTAQIGPDLRLVPWVPPSRLDPSSVESCQASCRHEKLSIQYSMNSNGTELNKSFTHIQHRARAVDQEGFVNQIPVLPPENLLPSQQSPVLATIY